MRARSGAAGLNNANMDPANAGALAINTNLILSDAYIRAGANLNLSPLNNTDIVIDGQEHHPRRRRCRAGRRGRDRHSGQGPVRRD